MSTRTTYPLQRSASLLTTLLLAVLVGLSGCGADDPADGSAADPGTSQSDDQPSSEEVADEYDLDVPEQCHGVFVYALGGDAEDVESMPANWPQPFDDAVVCNTSSTLGDQQQNIDYAVDATREEILDAFESALAGLDGYDAERTLSEERGHDLITGQVGDVGFQIDTKESGGFTLTFVEQ